MVDEQEALSIAEKLAGERPCASWAEHSADLDAAAAMLRKLVAEREEQQRELIGLRARLDRAIKAAGEHFGEDVIRYKFSLMKNGRTRNIFPGDCDGKWFALQRADNDAHIGLCDRINQLEAEREEYRAAMRRALEVMDEAMNYTNSAAHSPSMTRELLAAITDLRQRLEGTT